MAITSWNDPVSGDWSVGADWTSGAVPLPGDAAIISVPGGPYTVTVSSADFANSLAVNADQATLQENSGSLTIAGGLHVLSGLVLLNKANTIGSVSLSGGTLAVGNASALGTGTVTQSGGELVATASETLANPFAWSGNSTIAAAEGTTLTVKGSGDTIAAGSTLNFGGPGGGDGTVVWDATFNSIDGFPVINVEAGMLKGADAQFGSFISGSPISVAAGATLDLGGDSSAFANLTGAGVVTNSGLATTLFLDAANFSGTISGALKLEFDGAATLSGLEDTTGGAILDGATVTNAGTYDLVANTDINGGAGSSFVNNGTFEKTDGVGVSDVATDFVNNGALNVLSGSVEFTDGFTNLGVIHGRVTQSGGVTTVSALTPSDFNEDSLSDILWQNTATGQASVWEMSQNTKTGGGAVSQNPGTSLHAVGTGDFDGDGQSDILLQNMSTGQISVWEMEGNTKIGGGTVANSPGPVWQAIGSGDFDGDGLSDILFQNTSTGQVSVWEMTASIRTGGGAVANSPGPAWQAIGSGDFNGDGDSDILFQNTTTGRVSIWEMDGNTRTGGGAVTADPGLSWKAIGTGDFNHDGHADILFQNRTSGQVSIWEMDGNTRIGGGVLSQNPGTSWKAIGTGDFNGDGFADILFQNTSGQASIWDMDGTTKTSGGAVSSNPGPSWHAVG
jgi:hypothetical protein